MKNVPTFKTENGNYIYGERYVSALLGAVYSDKTRIEIDDKIVNIVESNRTEEEWIVIVSVDDMNFKKETNE